MIKLSGCFFGLYHITLMKYTFGMSNADIETVIKNATPYVINTLFDSIFTILGIVVGSLFGSAFELRSLVGTLITASISLGLSSGFSVYEAESIQEEKRIEKIEKALLTELEDTIITEKSKAVVVKTAVLVFLTPLASCLISMIPVFLAILGFFGSNAISFLIIVLDLALIFLSGLYFNGNNRLIKGIRMTVLGVLVFLIGFILNRLF